MKKTLIKIMALVLTLVTLFAFTACNTEIKNGIGMFAHKAEVGILPVCIRTKKHKLKLFHRTEFIIGEGAPVTGVPIAELLFKPDVLIAAILRGREVKIPRGQDTIEVGDTVILVTREMGLSNVTDALLS